MKKIILVLLIVVLQLFSNDIVDKKQTDLDISISLIDAISETIHSLQQERGASCGYVTSDGANFAKKLEKIKNESDLRIDKLHKVFNENIKQLKKYFSKKRYTILEKKLKNLSKIRDDVKNLKIDFTKTYSKYTQPISYMILEVSEIADSFKNKELSDTLYIYSTILLYKESIGQKRAALSSLFAKEDFSKEIFEYYITSNTQEKIYLKNFLHLIDDSNKALYYEIVDKISIRNVKKYEQMALDKLSGKKVSVSSSEWFETVTILINLIQKFEYKIFEDIKSKVDEVDNNTLNYLTKEEKKWIDTHTLKVGVEQWKPVVFSNTGKDIDGIGGDFTKLLVENTGLKIEVVNDNWDVLLHDFEDKKLDILPATYYTDARAKFGLYSDGYFKMKDAIYLKETNLDIKSLKDLEGKTLAIPKGYGTIDKLQKEFPKIKLVFTKDLDDSINRVLNGRVTAFYEGHIAAKTKIEDELIKGLVSLSVREFPAPSLHFFSKIDEPILQSIIQKGLKQITYKEKTNIISKWAGEDKKIFFTELEQKWIDKKEPIKYVYDPDWAPFEWKNELTQHTGIIADIVNIVSEKTGLNFVAIDTDKWSNSVVKMKNNQADMYSAVVSNKEREEYTQFTSENIYSTPGVIVSKSDDKKIYLDIGDDLKGKKVGVVKGYALESYMKNKYPKLNYIQVDSTKDGFEKLNKNEIDIFVINATTAQYYIKRKGYSNSKIVSKLNFTLDLKMAIQKDMPPEVLSILNKALKSISKRELNDIYNRWTDLKVETKTDWILIGQISGVIVLILLFVLYSNHKLKSIVKAKTKDMEKQNSELEALLSNFDKNVIYSDTDLKGIITHASEAFCEISGYKREELIGKPHSIVRHPDTDKELFKELWNTIQSGACFKAEIKNLRKDGSLYWVESKFEPSYNFEGEIVGYTALRVDITNKIEVQELSDSLELKVEIQTKDLKKQLRVVKTSERKQEELLQEVKLQKEFSQVLLDSQEQMIITTDGKILLSANETFFDFYAVDSVEDFIKTYEADCVCETFNTDAPEGYLQINMGRETWIEYVVSRSFGYTHKVKITMGSNNFIFSVSGAKLPGNEGMKSAVFTNITEMENTKQEVEQILANILLPVLITDKKERRILYANRYAQKQYGLPLEDIIGSNIDDVYTVEGQQQHIIDAIKKDGYIENSEENFQTATGKQFTALLSVIPIMYRGIDSYIGMVADITEQKLREKEIADIHKHTKESIEYASLIQGALIPDNKLFRNYFQDYFAIWHPKDLVGGDIYLFEELRDKNECLLMVIDCTGHGVPGAFVTMLVKAIERQIVSNIKHSDEIVSPANILSVFNRSMKHLLRQENKDSISNAGFDGGIIYYNKKEKIIKFAGAETPLFYVEDDELKVIKGSRYSVGYKKCDADYEYKEHTIEVKEGMQFYLTTDGYLDQNGGEKGFPFGKKRFQKIINEYYVEEMADQQEIFLNELDEYQDEAERNDDVTFIGFKI